MIVVLTFVLNLKSDRHYHVKAFFQAFPAQLIRPEYECLISRCNNGIRPGCMAKATLRPNEKLFDVDDIFSKIHCDDY